MARSVDNFTLWNLQSALRFILYIGKTMDPNFCVYFPGFSWNINEGGGVLQWTLGQASVDAVSHRNRKCRLITKN